MRGEYEEDAESSKFHLDVQNRSHLGQSIPAVLRGKTVSDKIAVIGSTLSDRAHLQSRKLQGGHNQLLG